MNDLRREILTQVAAGKLSAAEGAARLDALETEPAVPFSAQQSPTSDARSGIKQVRVFARLGNTEIIGDPSVSYAVAEGPHKARQEGDTMVIEQSPLDGEASFGANQSRAKRGQIAVLGPGGALTVEHAKPGTRFVLMAGKPYGEAPIYNGPYVD